MAKYDITYSCGHSGEINIAGPVKLRQGRADWEAAKVCTDCYRAEQRRKGEAVAAEQSAAGLPELQGSDKQIAWAATIRAAAVAGLEAIEQQIADLVTEAGGEVNLLELAPTVAATRAAIERVRRNPSAKFWIDNRERSARSLLGDALKA